MPTENPNSTARQSVVPAGAIHPPIESPAESPPIEHWVGPIVRSFLDPASANGAADSLLAPLRFLRFPAQSESGAPALPLPAPPLEKPSPSDRAELAESLLRYNQRIDHPQAQQLCALLADSKTEVVVTGQQAGLFGGPIYSISKALAATLWAKALTDAGRPAVAVFWIASEDHDFDEVRSACFGAHTLSLAAREDSTRPVGERMVDAKLLHAMAKDCKECCASEPSLSFLEDTLELARSCYREGESFSLGFARLMPQLLGDSCPLLLDSQDPVLKQAQVDPVLRMVEEPGTCIDALEAREREIEAAGFNLQVGSAKQTDGSFALPLFLHRDGCRFRVIVSGGEGASERDREGRGETASYSLRGYDEVGSLKQLAERIKTQPSLMSPSALLRPILQDAALGTTLQVLGPGEVAYVPQAAPLYDCLSVEAPTITLRPQAVCLPARLHQHFVEICSAANQEQSSDDANSDNANSDDANAVALTAADVLGNWPALESKLALVGDNGTMAALDECRTQLLEDLAAVRQLAKELDPQLDGAVDKTTQHIERGLDNFKSRVEKASAQQAGVVRGRVDKIRELALPNGKLQERALCALWLRALFGPGVSQELAQKLSLDPRRLQVLPIEGK